MSIPRKEIIALAVTTSAQTSTWSSLLKDKEQLLTSRVNAELDGMLQTLRELENENLQFLNQMDPMLLLLELAMMHVFYLVHDGDPHSEEESQLSFWYTKSNAEVANRILHCLLTNLFNTILAFRSLCIQGLDAPSKVILRYLIELGDTILAVLYDHQYCTLYIDGPEDFDENRSYWYAKLSLAHITPILKKLDHEMGTAPAEAWETKKATYSWLSKYTHPQPVAQLISAMPRPLPGSTSGSSLGGKVSMNERINLATAASYFLYFSASTQWILLHCDHIRQPIVDIDKTSWLLFLSDVYINLYFQQISLIDYLINMRVSDLESEASDEQHLD